MLAQTKIETEIVMVQESSKLEKENDSETRKVKSLKLLCLKYVCVQFLPREDVSDSLVTCMVKNNVDVKGSH